MIEWDDEPQSKITWDDDEAFGEIGKNLAGATEAALTAPGRFIGGLARGTARALVDNGGTLKGAADSFGTEMNSAMVDGYVTDRGQQAMEAIGHYAYEVPRELFSDKSVALGELRQKLLKKEKLTPDEEAQLRLVAEGGFDVAGTLLGLRSGKGKVNTPPTPEEIATAKAAQNQPNPAVFRRERPSTVDTTQYDQPDMFPQRQEQPMSPINPAEGVQGEMFDNAPARVYGEPMEHSAIQWDSPLTDESVHTPEQPAGRAEAMPSIDFPFRQEALERDPRIYDLKEAYEAAKGTGHEQGVLDLAKEYLRASYAIGDYATGKDLNRGMGGVEGKTALPIENRGPVDLSAPQGWNPIASDTGTALRIGGKFAKQVEKGDAGLLIDKGRAYSPAGGVGKAQGGAINFDAFSKSKVLKLEDRLDLARRQLERLNGMIRQNVDSLERARADGDLKAQREHLENINVLNERLQDAAKGFKEFSAMVNKPKAGVHPLGGVGKKQGGAVKLPGGNWRNSAKKKIVEALGLHAETSSLVGRGLDTETIKSSAIHNDSLVKMVNNYVNKYLGTSKDPLKDFTLPTGERWEDVTDSVVQSVTKSELADKLKKQSGYSRKAKQDVISRFRDDVPGSKRIGNKEPIWSVTENDFHGRSMNKMEDWLLHVGEYFDQLSPEQKQRMDMARLFREVKQRDEADLRSSEKKKAEVAKRSMENATIVKRYADGSAWVKLDKPGQFAAESDMMGHSVRGYEPPGGKERRGVDLPDHPDWIEGAEGGHENYGHGGWEAIKRGDAEVYSLRDKNGEAHVTVEVQGPNDKRGIEQLNPEVRQAWIEKGHYKPAITQIKGKGNARPADKYQAAITDFIKSKEWGDIKDVHNTELMTWQSAMNKLQDILDANRSIPPQEKQRARQELRDELGHGTHEGPKYLTNAELDKIISDHNLMGDKYIPKGQRGSIGDPEFLKFKNNLPTPLKGKANALWKAIKDEEASTNAKAVSNSGTLNAVANVPGLDKALEHIAPTLGDWDKDIKPKVMAEPDINLSATGRGMTAGPTLTAFWKKSTGVKYAAETINKAKIEANRNTQVDLIDNLKPAIEKLKDLPEVWDALRTQEGKTDALPEGLSPEGQAVATQIRTYLKKRYDAINAERAEVGMKPILYRQGYLPGMFTHDFRFMAYDKETGEIKGVYGRNTKGGAESYRKELAQQDPTLRLDQVKYRPIRGQNRYDVMGTMQAIYDLLPDMDPRKEAVKSSFEELIQNQAFDYEGVKKHFMPKKKVAVQGARGFEDIINPVENARQGLQATMEYMERVDQWVEIQKAGRGIRKILADPEIIANKPELVKYLNLYWDTISGRGTAMKRAVDAMTSLAGEYTRMGETNIKDFNRTLKSGLTTSFLSTPIFWGIQSWQPMQMVPTWMAYLKTQSGTGNVALSHSLGSIDAAAFASGHDLTPVGKEFTDWAKANKIFDSNILDDIRYETTDRTFGNVRDAITWPIRKIESYSRVAAGLMFAHYLHGAGMPMGEHLYTTAMNLTNMSMTDYHLHERPLVYQQLGAVGELMSTLTAFKHNQYTQLAAMAGDVKEPGRRNSLITMVALQAVLGGALGMYGIDELDSIINAANSLSAKAGHYADFPTIRTYLLTHAPDWFTFGGASVMTGLDLSSRFSASNPVPDDAGDALFPYGSDVKRKLGAMGDMLSDPNAATGLKNMHAWAPNALKFAPELLGTKKGMPAYNPQREEGGYRRDGFDWGARVMGGRSLKESSEMMAVNEAKTRDQHLVEAKTRILERVARDPQKYNSLLSDYVKMGGNKTEFDNKINEYALKKATTSFEREQGLNPTTLNDILKARRAREYK